MVKALPSNAGGTGSLPSQGPWGQKYPKCCNKFNKDFKKMVHIKKKKIEVLWPVLSICSLEE